MLVGVGGGVGGVGGGGGGRVSGVLENGELQKVFSHVLTLIFNRLSVLLFHLFYCKTNETDTVFYLMRYKFIVDLLSGIYTLYKFFSFQGNNPTQLEKEIGSVQLPANEHYFGLVNVSSLCFQYNIHP